MKRLAFLLSTSALLALTSCDESEPASEVQTELHDRQLGPWMKLYWTWVLGGDQTGSDQGVVFLPLPDATDPDGDMVLSGEIDVDLAEGDEFALSMFVWVGETYQNGEPPDDDPTMPPKEMFTDTDVVVTLDGESIIDSAEDDLDRFFFDAQNFDATIDYAMPTDYGAIGAIWVKGIGFLHDPLPPGEHVLHLEEFSESAGVGFSNTWNITVRE